MMDEFYIDYNHQQLGPYDLMTMIRKIRNGQITRETIVYASSVEGAQKAGDLHHFFEIFIEAEQERAQAGSGEKRPLSFVQMIKAGLESLTMNLVMSVYTGIFLIVFVAVVGAFFTLIGGGAVLMLLISIVAYFLFSLYLLAILRKTRMQLLSMQYFKSILQRSGLQLLIVSALLGLVIFGIPGLIAVFTGPVALALILLPGSVLMMLFLFAPIAVADRGLKAKEALLFSKQAVMSLGRDNFIALYLVLLVNFIGGAILLVPLLLTLPVTISALCEVYDEHFNELGLG